MYRTLLEKLYTLFGYETIALCPECLSVSALENFEDTTCPICETETGDNMLVFDNVALLVDYFEAHEINVYGAEVCGGAGFPAAVMNMCYCDLCEVGAEEYTQPLPYSLSVAW